MHDFLDSFSWCYQTDVCCSGLNVLVESWDYHSGVHFVYCTPLRTLAMAKRPMVLEFSRTISTRGLAVAKALLVDLHVYPTRDGQFSECNPSCSYEDHVIGCASVPFSVVIAFPCSATRSSPTHTPTTPPRGLAACATSSVLPSLAAQCGPRKQ